MALRLAVTAITKMWISGAFLWAAWRDDNVAGAPPAGGKPGEASAW